MDPLLSGDIGLAAEDHVRRGGEPDPGRDDRQAILDAVGAAQELSGEAEALKKTLTVEGFDAAVGETLSACEP